MSRVLEGELLRKNNGDQWSPIHFRKPSSEQLRYFELAKAYAENCFRNGHYPGCAVGHTNWLDNELYRLRRYLEDGFDLRLYVNRSTGWGNYENPLLEDNITQPTIYPDPRTRVPSIHHRVFSLRSVIASNCATCGVLFGHYVLRRRYCSVECYQSSFYKKKPRTEKKCAHCGDPFISKNIRGEYCSTSCRVMAYRLRKKTGFRRNPGQIRKQLVSEAPK